MSALTQQLRLSARTVARFTLLFACTAQIPPAEAWTNAVGEDRATDVAILPGGDVISAGVRTGSNSRLSVARHAESSGAPLWNYDLTTEGPPYASALVAVDTDGSVVAAGYQKTRYGPYTGAAAKLSAADGTMLWRFEPAEPMGFRALASYTGGDVVLAGSLSLTQEEPANHAIVVLRLDGSSGEEIWRFVLDGFQGGNGEDELFSVVVGSSGDVFVAGSYKENQTLGYADFAVMKLSGSSGNLLWRHTVPSVSAHGGVARSLRLNADGDILATGWAVLAQGWCDIVLVRLNPATGDEIWRAAYDTNLGCEGGYDLAIDDDQGVFVAANASGGIFSVLKYRESDGTFLWRRDLPNDPGSCLGGGCAGAIAIRSRADGAVFVAGRVARAGPNATLTRLAGTSGSVIWTRHPTVEGCDDSPNALELDDAGNPVLASQGWGLVDGVCSWPSEPRYTVVKLTGSTGKDYWEGCHDDLDNDADGFADYPADPGCRSPSSGPEDPPCDDGFDNDGDGSVDLGDPGCGGFGWSRESPRCQDGFDNDGREGIDFDGGASLDLNDDGLIDAAFNPEAPPIGAPDPQCVGKPGRDSERPGCGLGAGLVFILPVLAALRRQGINRGRSPSQASKPS